MKKLEIVIKSESLEDLEKILTDCNASDTMILNVMSYNALKGHKTIYRGAISNSNLSPKVKVETIVPDNIAKIMIDRILKEINIEDYDNGKIFVYDAESVIKISSNVDRKNAL